ncbi:MAG TPA: hypothetical protein VIL36_15675 [Acidimicrobiales bacterium]
MPEKPHIVEQAEEALDRRTPSSPDGATVADQQAQTRRGPLESGTVQMTRGQWHGMVVGGLVGVVLGVLIALPFAAIPFMEPVGARILLVAVLGALAGAAAGGVYGGGRGPELEGEVTDADGRPSIGTSLRDPGTDARGR